jgi:hypothetical protein
MLSSTFTLLVCHSNVCGNNLWYVAQLHFLSPCGESWHIYAQGIHTQQSKAIAGPAVQIRIPPSAPSLASHQDVGGEMSELGQILEVYCLCERNVGYQRRSNPFGIFRCLGSFLALCG